MPGREDRHGPGAAPSRSLVRSQLHRILASDIFARSERLSVFLRFVVEQTLDGQASGLKEQVLGTEVYRRGPGFDGEIDSIVRVDARRLRDKLREYYAEYPQDPILISLPKGSYVPAFKENPDVDPAAGPPKRLQVVQLSHSPRWRWLALSIGLATVLGGGVIWSLLRPRSKPAGRAVPVANAFYAVCPGISPDGRSVVFSSRGAQESNNKADLWVQTIDDGQLRRLTDTPEVREEFPAWSPDSREISFVRDDQNIFVIPQAGRAERRVSSGTWADWAPDGKSLVIRDRERDRPFGIYQVFPDTGERRQLTQPIRGDGDWRAAISPNGLNLAFIRHEPSNGGDLYVLPMQGGELRRVTNWNARLSGVVWTPDGRDLIYSKDTDGLWRISANLTAPDRGSPFDGVSLPANNISISRPTPRKPARLVFQTYQRDLSFRIVDMTGELSNGVFQSVKPFPVSTQFENPGPFSPDNRHLAYVSGRPPEIWIAVTDGSGRRRIASLKTHPILGAWSPNGRRIVYTTVIDGNSDIFVVDTNGGSPRRMTFEGSEERFASWSRDGRWIYFSSNRAGAALDIWRIPVEGGPPVRITYHGGVWAREPPDEKYLYYVDRYPPIERMARPVGTGRLMQVPVTGGPEIAVLDGLTADWWSMADTGIFFISRDSDADFIDRYSFIERKVARVGQLARRAGQFGGQMHVSRDGRWALVTTHRAIANLMFVDNVR